MKDETIKKNLYDLEHNKYLNYQNILLITLATLFIAFIFNFFIPNKQIEFILKFFSVLVSMILAMIILIIFNSKLNFIKNKVKGLERRT